MSEAKLGSGPQRENQVSKQLNDLTKIIETLDKSVGNLKERLIPVCQERPTVSSEAEKDEVLVPVAHKIRYSTQALRQINNLVINILESLEV